MAVTPLSPVSSDALTSLDTQLTGEAIAYEHPDYDRARRVWNGMIDRRPALIARCADPADVVACVNFARVRELPLAVRGGGHGVGPGARSDSGCGSGFVWSTTRPSCRNTTRSAHDASCASCVTTTPATPR